MVCLVNTDILTQCNSPGGDDSIVPEACVPLKGAREGRGSGSGAEEEVVEGYVGIVPADPAASHINYFQRPIRRSIGL